MLFHRLHRIRHPEIFQGRGKTRSYFEGWYYKHVSRDGKHVWSVIPGVAFDDNGSGHAFIQLIDGGSGRTAYIPFELEEFSASSSHLDIRVGNSRFCREGMVLDAESGDIRLKADLAYSDITPIPDSAISPGIMGWYAFVPFMECYHGVVSLNHNITGSMSISGVNIDFSGGRGYIEKDWGRSFPSSWIWLQSNNFAENGTSLMISIARIPWIGKYFIGFTAVFLHQDRVCRFATYTRAAIEELSIEGEFLRVTLADKQYHLSVMVRRRSAGILKAPVNGKMERRISESIDADIETCLRDSAGTLLFRGTGRHGGAEIVGPVEELLSVSQVSRQSRS